MNNENRKKRFQEAIKYLISIGMVDGKSITRSISSKMKRNSSNISTAMRGDSRYLNPKFVRDFCANYNNIISEEWLWDGVGEMLSSKDTVNIENYLTDDKLMDLTKIELISLVKQLMVLHNEQTEMYRLLIRQNDEMIRNGQERFTNITKLISNNVK